MAELLCEHSGELASAWSLLPFDQRAIRHPGHARKFRNLRAHLFPVHSSLSRARAISCPEASFEH